MPFASLGLSAELARAVAARGYDQPTPIQARVIPAILAGRDVMAGAQTGTGKTAGFALPLLQRLSQGTPGGRRRPIRALVLAPTRELAAQVEDSFRTYGKFLALRSALIHGGVGFHNQFARLRDGVDIVVATPGRLLDHVTQRTVDLSRVEYLVLDEADRMLDMGFIRDIRKIIALLPRERQSLMFSATTSSEVQGLARDLMKAPEVIQANPTNAPTELVEQAVHPVDRRRKRELLTHLIREGDWRQVLIFTRTKHGANRLAQDLVKDGIRAAAIHGNKSQGARTEALASFKRGEVRALVATDIAARGLDIAQLPHVVNFELPNTPEDYVHRIGRTGRAGNEGCAVSLVCVDEREFLSNIERLLRQPIPKVLIPGFEPDPSIRAEPIILGRSSQGQRRPAGPSRGGHSRSHDRGAPAPRRHAEQSDPTIRRPWKRDSRDDGRSSAAPSPSASRSRPSADARRFRPRPSRSASR